MPVSMSAALKAALRAQDSDKILVALLTITHEEIAGGVVRLAKNSQNVFSRGNTFVAFPFDLILPDDQEDTPPKARVVLDNISREIVAWVRTINPPAPTVTIELVLADVPDHVEIGFGGFQLGGPTYDAQTVTADLELDDDALRAVSRDVFGPSVWPALPYANRSV